MLCRLNKAAKWAKSVNSIVKTKIVLSGFMFNGILKFTFILIQEELTKSRYDIKQNIG